MVGTVWDGETGGGVTRRGNHKGCPYKGRPGIRAGGDLKQNGTPSKAGDARPIAHRIPAQDGTPSKAGDAPGLGRAGT